MRSIDKDKILRNLGVFCTSEAISVGFSQPTIWRKAALGEIIKLAHGFYMHPEANIDPGNIDFIVACKKFGPSSFISGLSTLFRYGLIDEVPDRIWVVVPENIKTADPLYRCIRSIHDVKAGVIRYKNFRMANVHRSIIDGLHYSTKIGKKTAISAARKALREGTTSESKLYKIAKRTNLIKTLNHYWDAITSD